MLSLPIKRKWYYMIKSKEKKEEYRDISPYYTSRFNNAIDSNNHLRLKLVNGYSSNSPYIIVNARLSTGYGNSKWGAPDYECYILTIISIEE